jgi:hypothetical protein
MPQDKPGLGEPCEAHQWMRTEFVELHEQAVEARIAYEVHKGEKDAVMLEELEHVLSHVRRLFQGDDSVETEHIRSHLERCIVEAYERIAEDVLLEVSARRDPHKVHPFLARLLMVEKPKRSETYEQKYGQIIRLIREGRKHKGHHGSFERSRDAFRQAVDDVRELDLMVPSSYLKERQFTLAASAASAVFGALLGLVLGLLGAWLLR